MNSLELLQQHFGFPEFRPGQQQVVEALLAGHNAAAVFPTGAGKSLCYQLPALELPGVTLVVSPLIALMKDQIDALLERGIAAARLDSTLDLQQYRQVLSDAREGRLKLLYVAPERFNNERFRQSLQQLNISLFAVDEAHCVSEWGHNFRPDYLKLVGYAKMCRAERLLALTATATPRVLDDICANFSIAAEHAVRTPFYRPNLLLRTMGVQFAEQKLVFLTEALNSSPSGPTIVYVTLQRTAMQVAEALSERGFEARPYHAGLDPEVRAETQEWFLASNHGIVVATIAFGMGIDKPDIRYVYHYDPPKSLENYAQEIGRAGRDGEPSVCQLFLYPPDRLPLENFVYGDTPTREAILSLVKDLFGGEEELLLQLNRASNQHDIRILVLRTLLTYLELKGYLKALTPIYGSYRFKPVLNSAEILEKFEGDRRQFLTGLFRQAVKKRVWCEIDIDEARKKLECDRQRVVRALDYLGNQGWLELKASDLRYRYQVVRRPHNLDDLADQLHQDALAREKAEIARLDQVFAFASEPGCRAARLSAHFGETIETPCGHCGHCLGETQEPVATVNRAAEVELGELPQELQTPRAVARFLCGITSPQLSRSKLTRHPRFGEYGDRSFEAVLSQARRQSARQQEPQAAF